MNNSCVHFIIVNACLTFHLITFVNLDLTGSYVLMYCHYTKIVLTDCPKIIIYYIKELANMNAYLNIAKIVRDQL